MIFYIFTALALNAPMSPAEQVLTAQCLEEGASEAECACGLDIMRDRLTVREMELFAEVTPFLAEQDDPLAALGAATDLAQEKGFTSAEIATAIEKFFVNASEVEARCVGAGAPPEAPEDQAEDEEIVEGLIESAGDDTP